MIASQVQFVIVLFFSTACQSYELQLKNEIPTQANISSNFSTLVLQDVDLFTTYVLFQVHSHIEVLTLSMDETVQESRYTNGTHIGILIEIKSDDTSASAFVKCSKCDPHHNVTAIVMATAINNTDPIPGGCNMEFPLEDDPNMVLRNSSFINYLEFQYANIGRTRNVPEANCEDADIQKKLTYEIYHQYLDSSYINEEVFLKQMKKALNSTEVVTTSKKVTDMAYGNSKPLVDFASYYGQGSLFMIVVTERLGNRITSSAYVPILTYNCQMNSDGSCNMKTSEIISLQALFTVLAVAGALLCFVGHRLFKTSMFIYGFLAIFLVSLTIIINLTRLNFVDSLWVSVAVGIIGGVLWWLVWCLAGLPVLSVLVPGLVLGYFLAGIVLVTTPIANLSIMKSSFNYGMGFACGILIPVVFLLFFSRVLHIFACTFIGSLLVVTGIDMFIQGNVQRIFMNIVKKTLVTDYLQIHNLLPPITVSDVILFLAWIALFFAGCVFQYMRERKKPQFPPCPYREYRHRRMYHPLSGLDIGDSETDPLLPNVLVTPTASQQRVSSTGERDPFDSDTPRRGILKKNRSPKRYPPNVAGFYEDGANTHEIIDPI